jgi:hypothetical protein
MKDLIGKIGRFCENHVEKVVLALVAVVCAWLFFTRVIFSPNSVALDRTGKAFAPSQVDRHILEGKVPDLRAKLSQQKKSASTKSYARKLDGAIKADDPVIVGIIDRPLPKGFAGLFESPLAYLGASQPIKPSAIPEELLHAGRKYRLPLVPDVTDVAAGLLRAAAYVPLQEVTLQTTYDKAAVEPNDIDLVTVEAKFDVAELYRRFKASFDGVDVQKEEWRDPCLAKPVFAAVQLERQERREDGAWSDWQPLPRSRVESNRQTFGVIERVADLPPGGLKVRLAQYSTPGVTNELLQPDSYQIASAEEDWFPPTYYAKYKELQKKVDAEKKRDEKEKDRKQNDRGGTDLRREQMNRGGMQGGGGPYGGGPAGGGRVGPGGGRIRPNQQGGDPMYNQRGGPGGRIRPGQTGAMPGGDPMYNNPRSARTGGRTGGLAGAAGDPYGMMGPGGPGTRTKSTTNEVFWEFGSELIKYREDLSKRDKPLLIWVCDDTTEPGKTYQYRVRLGVFNPVAGTDQLVERDMEKKDQVILWSPYSPVTAPVEVQKRIYLFAKDAQEKTGTATVEVARYSLGYWYSQDFQVKLGESIGKIMEEKEDERDRNRLRAKMAGLPGYPPGSDRITDARGGPMGPGPGPGYGPLPPGQQNRPKEVNYRTGKVLVDLVAVNDWGNAPNLRPRTYHDMLYTSDGTYIEHMPVSLANWPRDLTTVYHYVQAEKRKEPQPFRAFSKGGMRGRGRGGPGGEMEGYGEPGMYDDVMGGAYDQMGPGPYGGGPYP